MYVYKYIYTPQLSPHFILKIAILLCTTKYHKRLAYLVFTTHLTPLHPRTPLLSICHPAQYTLQHPATPCNTLQHPATHCNALQRTAQSFPFCPKDTATQCKTLQHTATHCNLLQHTFYLHPCTPLDSNCCPAQTTGEANDSEIVNT